MDSPERPPSHLVSVGLHYVRKEKYDVERCDLDQLEQIFESFITGKSTYEESASSFKNILGTTAPLDKIKDILEVGPEPLPEVCDKIYASPSRTGMPMLLARKKARPWTEEEDKRLLAAIHIYGTDQWNKVASFVGSGRKRAQCTQRWVRGLNPKISKDLWSKDEEDILVSLVDKYGDKSWTRVATELGTRCDAQCRYRYSQIIRSPSFSSPSINQTHSAPVMPPTIEGVRKQKKYALPSITSITDIIVDQPL